MRVAVLSSSRADYGIFLPLLKALHADGEFELELVVFGTHLSPYHGYTVEEIRKDGFEPYCCVETLLAADTEEAIAGAMGLTTLRFASYWAEAKARLTLAFCLGDRFEMFAAAAASVPFNIPLAHVHGGETTLGAIDNVFRHSISHIAKHHFVSTETYAKRVAEMIGSDRHIHTIGALSLDNLQQVALYGQEEFARTFCAPVNDATVLVTLHPETRNPGEAERQAHLVVECLLEMNDLTALVTMPNADTAASSIRAVFSKATRAYPKKIQTIENLGTRGYLSAMSHCAFLLGNSSSGIIEAASFGRYAINLGRRQEGRVRGPNVIDVPFERQAIRNAIRDVRLAPALDRSNIYWKGGAAKRIIEVLKTTRDA